MKRDIGLNKFDFFVETEELGREALNQLSEFKKSKKRFNYRIHSIINFRAAAFKEYPRKDELIALQKKLEG